MNSRTIYSEYNYNKNNNTRYSNKIYTYSPKVARMVIIATILISVISTFFIFSTPASGSGVERTKYFKSITIEEGDTLWSIASEYMSYEYDDIYEYISELKRMNGLHNDTIHAGCNIIVAYYN